MTQSSSAKQSSTTASTGAKRSRRNTWVLRATVTKSPAARSTHVFRLDRFAPVDAVVDDCFALEDWVIHHGWISLRGSRRFGRVIAGSWGSGPGMREVVFMTAPSAP